MVNVTYAEAVKQGWIQPSEVPACEKGAKQRRDLEGEEQAQLIALVRARYPVEGPLLIHVPNGGSRKNKFEGWRLKQQGVRDGVSDLFLPVARGGYFGLWIEFKATPPFDARVSTSQKTWVDLMRAQGYQAMVCRGPAEAMKAIDDYLGQPATRIQG